MEKYKVIKNAVSSQTLELLKSAMLIAKDAVYFSNGVDANDVNRFNDGIPNAFPISRAMFTEALLVSLLPLIEKETEKELYPTYSYARVYWNGSEMFKHFDREPCEYSVSVSVSIDLDPWPIWMDGIEIKLFPGDIVIYKGQEVEHWREPYTGNQQCQIFLHYVDKNGPYAEYKFDQRPMLGLQKA
jgi:hypothetical protein